MVDQKIYYYKNIRFITDITETNILDELQLL